MVESNIYERKENLENAKKMIEEFKKEYQRDIKDMRK